MPIDAGRAVDLYTNGNSLQEVANALGCTAPAVRYILLKRNIARRPRGGNQTGVVLDEAVVLGLHMQGASIASIAQKFGVGVGRVSRLVRKDFGRWSVRGEAHFRAVLTNEMVVEAKVLRLRKRWAWPRLEKWFGVNRSTLRKAVHGVCWNHVPDLHRTSRGLANALLDLPLQERVVALYTSGQSIREVAANAGVGRESVRRTLRRCGVSMRTSCGSTTIEERASKVADAVEMYAKGVAVAVIARRLSISGENIRAAVVRAGGRVRGAHRKGAR